MNVGVSNFDAGYQLTRHLIERGYRNIGFLCARQEQWMLQQRMQGWQKALLDNYLSPDAIINTSERPSFSTGATMLGEFLLRWSGAGRAICVNDELAAGVLFECQRRHLNVPGKSPSPDLTIWMWRVPAIRPLPRSGSPIEKTGRRPPS